MKQKSRIFLTLLNITGVLSSFGGLVIATLIMTEALPDTSWILQKGSYFDFNKSATRMGIFLIFVSFFLLIITTIGCLGSLCNFRILLVVYAILLMVLIVFQVSGIMLLFTRDAKNKRFLEYFLEQVLNDYKETKSGLERSFSSVFTEMIFPVFSCCGVNNITDFNTTITKWKPNLENRPVNFSGFLVPKECCRNPNDNSSLRECLLQPTDQNAYTKGCFLVIDKVLETYSDAFALIAILSVSFQEITCPRQQEENRKQCCFYLPNLKENVDLCKTVSTMLMGLYCWCVYPVDSYVQRLEGGTSNVNFVPVTSPLSRADNRVNHYHVTSLVQTLISMMIISGFGL